MTIAASQPSSKWFASMVALLVALGTQVLIENVLPAGLEDLIATSPGGPIHIAGESWWRSEAAIRFLSFTMGGIVAVRLAQGRTRSLLALLILVAFVATAFAQFPGFVKSPFLSQIVPLALWSLSAPIGVTLGAWVANAKRVA